MPDSAQVRFLKNYIVRAHRAGACGKFGEHVPRARMGERGSAYRGMTTAAGQRRYGQGYRRVFNHD